MKLGKFENLEKIVTLDPAEGTELHLVDEMLDNGEVDRWRRGGLFKRFEVILSSTGGRKM